MVSGREMYGFILGSGLVGRWWRWEWKGGEGERLRNDKVYRVALELWKLSDREEALVATQQELLGSGLLSVRNVECGVTLKWDVYDKLRVWRLSLESFRPFLSVDALLCIADDGRSRCRRCYKAFSVVPHILDLPSARALL